MPPTNEDNSTQPTGFDPQPTTPTQPIENPAQPISAPEFTAQPTPTAPEFTPQPPVMSPEYTAPEPVMAPEQAPQPAPIAAAPVFSSPQFDMNPEATSQQPFVGATPVVSQPMAPTDQAIKQKFAIKDILKNKLALIIGGSVLLITLLVAGFLLLKGPVSQVASNLGIGGITLENYSNEKLKFSLDAPKGWIDTVSDESYDNSGLATVSLIEPAGDPKDTSAANTHYAAMQVAINDTSKVSYGQKKEAEYFSSVKKTVQSLATQKSSSTDSPVYTIDTTNDITINGLKAYEVKYKIDNYNYVAGEKGVEYRVYVFVKDNLSYKIYAQAHNSDTDALNKFDSIINSFKHL